MLAARLGAWLRHTGERWAKAAFAEKLAVLLALGAVLYTIVTGAAELRYQARAREALAQVKAARLAASAVSAQCYSAGQTFADQTSADGFADGIAEEIRSTMHHSALFRGPEAPECLALCIRTKFFPPKVDFAGKSQARQVPRTICPYRILYQYGLFFNRPKAGQLKKNAENCEINAAIGAQPVFKTHSTRAYT